METIEDKKLILLKDTTIDGLLTSVDNIIAANKKDSATIDFDTAVNKLNTFLPNITFRDFTQLKLILKQHDSLKYAKFIKQHDYITYDPSGTSAHEFPYWEIMLDSMNATMEALVEQFKNNPKDLFKYKHLFDARDLKILSRYSANAVTLQRAMFFKKLGNKSIEYSARLEMIEAGLKDLIPAYNRFLAKLYGYGTTTKDLTTFNYILNRLEYMIEDEELTHPSNQEYLAKIKLLLNN